MPKSGIVHCDVCNRETSWLEGTIYSASEFRQLVEAGFEPDDNALSFMVEFGFSREQAVFQWKQGFVLGSHSDWLLCPACASRAARYLQRPVAGGTELESTDEFVRKNLGRLSPEDTAPLLKTDTGTFWLIQRNADDGTYVIKTRPDVKAKVQLAEQSPEHLPHKKTQWSDCPQCHLPQVGGVVCSHCGYCHWGRLLLNMGLAVGLGVAVLVSAALEESVVQGVMRWGGAVFGSVVLAFLIASLGRLWQVSQEPNSRHTALLPLEQRRQLIERADAKKMEPCSACGLPIKQNYMTCPHCGDSDWGMIASFYFLGAAWMLIAFLWGQGIEHDLAQTVVRLIGFWAGGLVILVALWASWVALRHPYRPDFMPREAVKVTEQVEKILS